MEELSVDEIVNAVKQATNGTFIGSNSMTTLVGFMPVYDKEG